MFNTSPQPFVEVFAHQNTKIASLNYVKHLNFAGKSTLADRILELVGAVEASADNKQILDKLPVERERGITVKAQTASVIYEHKGK